MYNSPALNDYSDQMVSSIHHTQDLYAKKCEDKTKEVKKKKDTTASQKVGKKLYNSQPIRFGTLSASSTKS